MGPPSTETLTALASAQHGAVAISQLGDTDVTRRWVANLVRRGVLVRACPGVVLVAGSAPSWHRDLMVGLLALGESSWVSHEGAARFHGLDRTPLAPVEFTALRHARGRTLRFTVHTTSAMPKIDRVDVGGIRSDVGDAHHPRPGPRPGRPDAPGGGDGQCHPARVDGAGCAAGPGSRPAVGPGTGAPRCSTTCSPTPAVTRCSSAGSSS